MKDGVLIYGCYGYTGKLISELAVKAGLKPVLSGRDREKVASLAKALGLEAKAFDLVTSFPQQSSLITQSFQN